MAPTKQEKKSLEKIIDAWRCHFFFSQRGKLVFLQTLSLQFCLFTVYFQFHDTDVWHWISRHNGMRQSFISKLEIICLGAKIFLSVPPKSQYIRAPQVKMLSLSNAKDRSDGHYMKVSKLRIEVQFGAR